MPIRRHARPLLTLLAAGLTALACGDGSTAPGTDALTEQGPKSAAGKGGTAGGDSTTAPPPTTGGPTGPVDPQENALGTVAAALYESRLERHPGLDTLIHVRGGPIVGAAVEIFRVSTDSSAGRAGSREKVGSGVTDATGRISLSNVRAAPYVMDVSMPAGSGFADVKDAPMSWSRDGSSVSIYVQTRR